MLSCEKVYNVTFNNTLTPFQWVHIYCHEEADGDVFEHLDDEMAAEAITELETAPSVLKTDFGVVYYLRGVNLNKGDREHDMVSLRIYITKDRIVTAEKRKIMAVRDFHNHASQGTLSPETPVEAAGQIASLLLDRAEPVLYSLFMRISQLEEELADEDPDHEFREHVTEVRKISAVYSRYLLPQKNALAVMAADPMAKDPVFGENLNRQTRIMDELTAAKERCRIIQDELNNHMAERFNKNLYKLSIITILFLPLSFLTGLFGINVGGIPLANSPHGFWIITGISALVFAAIGLFFIISRRF